MPVTVNHEALATFTQKVFESLNVSEKNAQVSTDVLVAADLRGIPSHGVARLKRYVDGIVNGTIFPKNEPDIIKETPSTTAIDANAGLGQVAGFFATNLAIQKADKTGVGISVVKNSNHYGIAGYYSKMILEHGDLIGISMTNSAPLVVPTFGIDLILGTNPISVAAPTSKNLPFLLDMATSTVPRGKLEVYDREEKQLPMGWAVDSEGENTTDPGLVLNNLVKRLGGGLLPLGGEGESMSGYKGYGMAMIVDILSGILSGGAFADMVNAKVDGKPAPAKVGHFFMALKISNFVELDTFKNNMDILIEKLKNSRKSSHSDEIFIHGEKEFRNYDNHIKNGIPLGDKVFETLKEISVEYRLEKEFSKLRQS